MTKQILASFAFLALSAASAATFKVTLVDSTLDKGTTFKAGDYKLDVKQNSVVLTNGKRRVEIPAKIETSNQQYVRTHVIYNDSKGKYVIQEIELGGTTTKLTLDSGVQTGGGE